MDASPLSPALPARPGGAPRTYREESLLLLALLRTLWWLSYQDMHDWLVAWNPKRQKNRSCLPPTWTKEELGKRTSIERFFGRVFLFFHLQHELGNALNQRVHSLINDLYTHPRRILK
jgi:hypothetical protein